MLSVVSFEHGVLVLGEGAELPWVDTGLYLGCDPQASGLLVPTRERPNVALDLFERALRRQLGDVAGPLGVLPAWELVIPLRPCVTLSPAVLDSALHA